MPQETNLNVSPYFDDFDPAKNYYRVLFKPGLPVQARELTSLQAVLQDQVEQVGTHLFKEGSIVIPGQINYNNTLFAVEVEPEYLGIPIDSYADDLVNVYIRGQNSNVLAKIVFYEGTDASERGYYTFFVSYVGAGNEGKDTFDDDETLLLEDNVTTAVVNFQSGQGFANTAPINSTSIGSAVFLTEGVYFLRGTFVKVPSQTLILDAHKSDPSYRVGLEIFEEVISSGQDNTLTDNAKGFNNYAAPGADRLRISALLAKRPLESDKSENFVQLMLIRDGDLQHIQDRTQYNEIAEELARRTYDQSCLLYTSPSPRDKRQSRMPSSA